MDIDRSREQFAGYRSDAEAAQQRFLQGEQEREFCTYVMGLTHTYFESMPFRGDLSETDEVMVQLALHVHQQILSFGFWNEWIALAPHIRHLAEKSSNTLLFAEATKLYANLLSRRGDSAMASDLFVSLMEHSSFPRLPLYLQTDILVTAGTDAVWSGHLNNAERLLQQGSDRAEQCASLELQQALIELNGIRPTTTFMPWWENKAYALNQLGTLSLFRGNFPQAHSYLRECLNLLIEQGHEENLACVAYQGFGRVLFHEGRYAEAQKMWKRGLAIRYRRNDEEGIAVNSLYLGACEIRLNNLPEAERLLTEAFSIFQRLGNRLEIALSHLYLGELERNRGNVKAVDTQWHLALKRMKNISIPFVEQTILLRASSWLLQQDKWELLNKILLQARQSISEQKLSWHEISCLMKRESQTKKKQ